MDKLRKSWALFKKAMVIKQTLEHNGNYNFFEIFSAAILRKMKKSLPWCTSPPSVTWLQQQGQKLLSQVQQHDVSEL